MLTIKGLYKEANRKIIKELDIIVENKTSVSIECDSEYQNLLFDLILGREIPAKGELLIEGIPVKEYYMKYPGTVGIITKDDTLYEKMTVDGYLKFFSELLSSSLDYKAVMLALALLDIGSAKIKNLSYAQKRRVSLAREMLKNPSLLLFQEPILNLDKDGIEIIVENIQRLCENGTAVLLTSVYLKDTLLVGNTSYRLNEQGCIEINNKEETLDNKSETTEYRKTYTIEKIPAKTEDKVLLFDPMEIDYIESGDGISYLLIRGEKFPCSLSLTELEERLKYFGFFRSHRSYLVNLQRVREVVTWTRNSYSLNLDDKIKSSIPLSKGRLEELKNILHF